MFEVKKVIVGQDRAIERLLVCLLARGHALLEGVPGLAKTLAAETLATVVGGSYTRLQFTPDLLPADITGTRIYRASNEQFDVELGPDLRQLRAGRRDQPGAGQGAVGPARGHGRAPRVDRRAHLRRARRRSSCMATQNPIESEGVYPLPEAQRDRFLMKIVIGYPSPAEEIEIVHRMGVNPPHAHQVLGLPDLLALQDAGRPRSTSTTAWSSTRSAWCWPPATPASYGLPELEELLAFGASPRASLGLVAGARALALLRGRTYALPQDVYDVAPDVLRHRLVPSYEALAQGLTVEHLLTRLLSTVPAPRVLSTTPGPRRGRARPGTRLPAAAVPPPAPAPTAPGATAATRPDRRTARAPGSPFAGARTHDAVANEATAPHLAGATGLRASPPVRPRRCCAGSS